MSPGDADAFIRANTAIGAPALLPFLRLHLAAEITPIWQASETALAQAGIDPPFWAFAWAGGQALARLVTDRPELVAGRVVMDFGSGGGLVGIAAKRAGAARVIAVDIDPVASAAARLNAALNGVEIETLTADPIGGDPAVDIVLVGDLCYERLLAERLTPWLRRLAGGGITVLVGDPGRSYLPRDGMEPVASYTVPTSLELEDRTERETSIWRLTPPA
jgi:predicted nicotinamide N-methyase